MKLVPIGECVERVRSWNPGRDAPNQSITYVDLGSVDNDQKIIGEPQTVLGCAAPSRARQKLVVGDILVSTVRPYLNGVAKVPDHLDEATASTGFCVLRPFRSKIDQSYLFHWVKASGFIEDMVRKSTGASYPAVSDRIIHESLIPLPPLPEQKRIAAILDQADEVRRLRRKTLTRLSDLGQAIFIERFGRTYDMNRRRIGDFALVKGGKRLPKGVDYASERTNHPYIRVSNLSDGHIDPNGMKFISEEVHRAVARYIVRTNDVVISIAGTIGVVAPVRENLDGANLTENAAKITPKAGYVFDSDYLAWALQTPELRQAIRASTGKVTIGKLALFRIEDLAVPFPEIGLQREFSKQMKVVTERLQLMQDAAETADTLFTSLQHRAFRGEL